MLSVGELEPFNLQLCEVTELSFGRLVGEGWFLLLSVEEPLFWLEL